MSTYLKIAPSVEMLARYQAFQKKSSKAYTDKDGSKDVWQIYHIKEKDKVEQVEVEKANQETEDDDATRHKKLSAALIAIGEPRFAVVDMNKKIFFVSYIPEGSKIRDKMKYSSIKESVKGVLNGIHFKVDATDASELDYSLFTKQIKKI